LHCSSANDEYSPSTSASIGSSPNNVGAEMSPSTLVTLSTRSIILQSSLPGEFRRPRPIYRRQDCQHREKLTDIEHFEVHHLAKQVSRLCRSSDNDRVDIRDIRSFRQDLAYSIHASLNLVLHRGRSQGLYDSQFISTGNF
jgi:hypothetical protein